MLKVVSESRVGNNAFKRRVGKIVLGFLTILAVAWMVDSIRILYPQAPVLFWNFGFWKPLFGAAWLVFFDPLGPVTAYLC